MGTLACPTYVVICIVTLHRCKWILFRSWTESAKCSQREFVSCPGQLKTNQIWACCFLQSKLVQTKTQTRSPTCKLESQEHFCSTWFPLWLSLFSLFFFCFSFLLPSWLLSVGDESTTACPDLTRPILDLAVRDKITQASEWTCSKSRSYIYYTRLSRTQCALLFLVTY